MIGMLSTVLAVSEAVAALAQLLSKFIDLAERPGDGEVKKRFVLEAARRGWTYLQERKQFLPEWAEVELLARDLIDLEVAFRNRHREGWRKQGECDCGTPPKSKKK